MGKGRGNMIPPPTDESEAVAKMFCFCLGKDAACICGSCLRACFDLDGDGIPLNSREDCARAAARHPRWCRSSTRVVGKIARARNINSSTRRGKIADARPRGDFASEADRRSSTRLDARRSPSRFPRRRVSRRASGISAADSRVYRCFGMNVCFFAFPCVVCLPDACECCWTKSRNEKRTKVAVAPEGPGAPPAEAIDR